MARKRAEDMKEAEVAVSHLARIGSELHYNVHYLICIDTSIHGDQQ